MPPTGEEWTFKAMYVHRIAGGKIVEEWTEGGHRTISGAS